MPIYTINDQTIYTEEQGPANGPIAILIHGWSSSSFTWAPVVPVLSRRYRCIAVDLPGFGKSPAPKQPPTIAGYADMIASLIEQVSERPVLLLGHSMGGQINTTLALRHPMLVERMVLLNPALSGRLSTRVNLLLAPHVLSERFRIMEWLLYILAKTPLDYTDHLLKPSNFAERAQVSETDYQRIRADARRHGQGRVRAACYGAMLKGDLRGQLGRVEAPALVIWGAEDNIVPLRDAGAVAEEWADADLRLIPNAGHWPQFEQTDITLRPYRAVPGAAARAEYGAPRRRRRGPHPGERPLPQQHRHQRQAHASPAPAPGLAATHPRLRARRADRPREHLGKEMYIIKNGSPRSLAEAKPLVASNREPVRLAVLQAGQIVGELSLLDGAARSADLYAGPEGAMLLALDDEALARLAEDDPRDGHANDEEPGDLARQAAAAPELARGANRRP